MRNEVIAFKVDEHLLKALKGIPNRSDFIRNALLAALESTCPVCRGTGVLSPKQKKHWGAFLENHSLEECGDCHEVHLVCHQGEASEESC